MQYRTNSLNKALDLVYGQTNVLMDGGKRKEEARW